MADIDTRVDKLETKVTTLEQQVSNVMTKLDMFIAESREARQRHDAEIREMRKDMKEIQVNLDSKIDSMGKHVRNMTVAAIIGIATIVITVLLK